MKARLSQRVLREHPDLDQVKRQAKELLAAVATGSPEALAEVHARYPGADLSTFALHDAQLVLARSYGFDSWPKLKAWVDGVTVKRLGDAVRANDLAQVRAMLQVRPELVHMEMAADNEHLALHYAVLGRMPEMVRLLMEYGSDARKGIYPHREATDALTLAAERGYDEVVAVIREAEERRREALNRHATPGVDDVVDAITRGDSERAMTMLSAAPSLASACDRRGWTPLHAAVAAANDQMAEWLVEHGAEVNRRGPGEKAPLDMVAVPAWRKVDSAERRTNLVSLLRKHGAETTVRCAVAVGDVDWLRARHAAAGLTNPIEPSGGLLTIAVRHDRPEVLALLLGFGFDPDERTRVEGLDQPEYSWGMPLWHCALLGRPAMAEMLLEHGADPNGRVYASGSPMYCAYGQRDQRMISLLERYGGAVGAITVGLYRETGLARRMLAGDMDARLSDGLFAGPTVAEQLLWGGACGGGPEIVRMAIEKIEWDRDDRRWYPMLEQPLRMWNHMKGPWANPTWDRNTYFDCFRVILDRSDPDVRGRFGLTLLHDLAAARGHVTAEDRVTFATALLDAGARMEFRDDLLRSTPLGWACRWGRVELVKLFLSRGADSVEADAEGWATPVAWALKMEQGAILDLLQQQKTLETPRTKALQI